MTVRVRFFAVLRERMGRAELEWQVAPGDTVGALWEHLRAAFPRLAGAGDRVAFAVNREYVDSMHRLTDNDEVALIPPVSGGRFRRHDVQAHRRPHRPERGRRGRV